MPNQCVRCGNLYNDDAKELLSGCSCGGKFFFYMKKKDVEEAKKITTNLSTKEKVQIEKDVVGIIGEKIEDDDKPIILDLESIRLRKPGQYDLDLTKLFEGKPLVYKVEDGKYLIDIMSSFKKVRKK
ncbi:hypothetical protein CL621_04635 [archaeon]|nr:hypothetical protein [archaeon]|tara:strand:+ start:2287 stop:2667 length:381 start_codon:yes stop_codon:yes gene_type:complete